MSKFLTVLPVDLRPLLEALPKSAFQHQLIWNPEARRLELVWEDDGLESGLSTPVPFALQALKERKLPGGVKQSSKAPERPERSRPEQINRSAWAFRPHGNRMSPEAIRPQGGRHASALSRQQAEGDTTGAAVAGTTQPENEQAARSTPKSTVKAPRARRAKPTKEAEPESAPTTPAVS